MRYGQIPGLEKPVSRLVQGTMMINRDALEYSLDLLDGIFARGCTTFDSAHGYCDGDAERVLGLWMEARRNREQIVILTKGAHHNQDRRRVTPFDIHSDLHDSLARLRTDYIDLYLLHRDDPSVPVEPIVDTLNELKHLGSIRAFGGSNWSHQRLRQANEYAERSGQTPFTLSSPNVSLAEQVDEPWAECITLTGRKNDEARKWYAETQMPVFAWSSLASGFFTGRFRRENLTLFPEEDYWARLAIRCYASEDNFKRLDRAEELARQKGMPTPQIALAYVLNLPLNLFALVGCRTPQEFEVNLGALEIKLTPDEMKWLNLEESDRE
jgi:aryl-alcohol dehydrogenase-like predicted oxidoreductase